MSLWTGKEGDANIFNHLYIPVILQATFKGKGADTNKPNIYFLKNNLYQYS